MCLTWAEHIVQIFRGAFYLVLFIITLGEISWPCKLCWCIKYVWNNFALFSFFTFFNNNNNNFNYSHRLWIIVFSPLRSHHNIMCFSTNCGGTKQKKIYVKRFDDCVCKTCTLMTRMIHEFRNFSMQNAHLLRDAIEYLLKKSNTNIVCTQTSQHMFMVCKNEMLNLNG